MNATQTNEIAVDCLNMKYILKTDELCAYDADNKYAILHCNKTWTIDTLREWLPGFSYDALETVKMWLDNDAEIAAGNCLKIWID